MALLFNRFFNWLRELADGGTYIKTDGHRVRIPDDWQRINVRGDGLNRWNIKDNDELKRIASSINAFTCLYVLSLWIATR